MISALRVARTRLMPLVRRYHIDQEGKVGENLPFDINNKYKLLALMGIFLGSGFGAPYLVVRHQLLKG